MKAKQLTILALIFALVVTMIPVQPASAAQITLSSNLGSHNTEDNAMEVYTPTITISGIVTGAAPADVRYSVEQVSTGFVDSPNVTPATSGNEFTFQSVQLFVGMNKITLRVTGTEISFYAYYLDAPSVSAIEILDPISGYQLLKQYDRLNMLSPFVVFNAGNASEAQERFDKVMRTSPSNVNIRGQVNNVSRVFINGDEILSTPTNVFIHNLAQNGIYKGDHTIYITGQNVDGSSFSFPYSFAIYNDQPTFLNVGIGNPDTSYLEASSPNFVNLSGTLDLAGHLYVPEGQAGQLDAVRVILKKNGSTIETNTISFTDDPAHLSDPDWFVTDIAANSDNIFVDTNGNYRVYRIESTIGGVGASLPTDTFTLELAVDYRPTPTSPPQTYRTQSFEIKSQASDDPAVLDVVHLNSNQSLLTNPIINSRTETYRVYVTSNTTNVTIETDMDPSYTLVYTISPKQSIGGRHYFDVQFDNIRRGNQTLTFTPNGASAIALEIPVNVTLTPSVKISGLANNQSFSIEQKEIPIIKAQYVNLDSTADRANTVVRLNGVDITNTSAVDDDLTGDSFDIILGWTQATKPTDKPTLREGANTLEIILTSTASGQTTETIIRLTFFYLPIDTPQIGVFEPRHISDSSNIDAFQAIPGQVDSYVTLERSTQLYFTLTNNKAEVVYLQKNGEDIARWVRANDDGSSWDFALKDGDSWNETATPFITGALVGNTIVFSAPNSFDPDNTSLTEIGRYLSLLEQDEQGDTIFNTITTYTINAYRSYNVGSSPPYSPPLGTRTIVIHRQSALFEFTPDSEADIVMNKDKGIINKNFFPFDILTEKADKVVVNKIEAKKDISYTDDTQGRERYLADIPLKRGANKITVEITRGEHTTSETFEVFYSDTVIPGTAYRETLGKNTRFRVFDRSLELRFPKGTILTAPHSDKHFNKLLNEVPIMFGMADPEFGIISEVEKNHAERYVLADRIEPPYNFDFVGPLYWIDAGTVDNPGGLIPLDSKLNEWDEEETFMNRSKEIYRKYNLKPTQRGELTISFNEEIRNEMGRRISVWRHDGEEWINVGGILNAKNNTFTVPFDEFGYYAVMRQRESYRDIIDHPWAKEELELLSSRDWMRPSGYGGNFGAYDTANRGEFATMLVKIFNIPLDYDGRPTFHDVPVGFQTPRYDYRYIETAARVGIVHGKSVGMFDPEGTLTREQAAVMIARAANYRLQDYERAQQRLDKLFVDGNQVNRYAVPSVLAVAQAGIIEGIPVINVGQDSGGRNRQEFRFNPNGMLTRDQLAVIAVRLLRNQKLL